VAEYLYQGENQEFIFKNVNEAMIVGIIPARGGSKGLPRKNIRDMAGYPLIYWTIEAAKNSKLLDDFYVSTDDVEIADIAQRFGAKVLIRSPELAKDDTTTLAVLIDIVNNKISCDEVMVLQPTSPLRNPDTIDECIIEFRAGKFDTLATGFYTKIIEYASHQNMRRQDIKGFFYDDGNVYIIKADLIKQNRWYGDNICRKVLDRELNYEIDDPIDFKIIESLLRDRLNEGKQPFSIYEKLKGIKLFAMDVDGVLTDAGMYYSERGDELKKFNTHDGKGIELIKNLGIKTAIITSENTKIVEQRAKKLKVDFIFQGIKDKAHVIGELAGLLKISMDEIAYIGDDVNDVSALEIVGLPITVKNASEENKAISQIIIPLNGGEGCVRYICDMIINSKK